MSQFVTAMTGAGTVVAVGLTMVARAWHVPAGRHRKPRPAPVHVPLDALLGPTYETPHGAACTPRWAYCPRCEEDAPGAVHGDGWQCGQCLLLVAGGGR